MTYLCPFFQGFLDTMSAFHAPATMVLSPAQWPFFTLDALPNGFPCDAQELRCIPSRQDIADDIE